MVPALSRGSSRGELGGDCLGASGGIRFFTVAPFEPRRIGGARRERRWRVQAMNRASR